MTSIIGSSTSAAARCNSRAMCTSSATQRSVLCSTRGPCIQAPPLQRAPAFGQCHYGKLAISDRSGRCLRVQASADESEAAPSAEAGTSASALMEEQGSRDDDVLPDSLTDALEQSSVTTRVALADGVSRCIVEVLLGEFWDPSSGAVFSEEGDQQRFWKLTRRFVEGLTEGESPYEGRIKVLYPDMGVAAMLKNQWPEVTFRIGSLGDRSPIGPDDDVIVLAAPDPQALGSVQKVVAAAEAAGLRIIMFNPRLASGDVGIGLNVRRMQTQLLNTFVTCYSLRPVGDVGSVYRRYPDPWKVFVEDSATPGRYKLAAERTSRPAGEGLDEIIMEALGMNGPEGEEGGGPGVLTQLSRTMISMQRFMRSLSA